MILEYSDINPFFLQNRDGDLTSNSENNASQSPAAVHNPLYPSLPQDDLIPQYFPT